MLNVWKNPNALINDQFDFFKKIKLYTNLLFVGLFKCNRRNIAGFLLQSILNLKKKTFVNLHIHRGELYKVH